MSELSVPIFAINLDSSPDRWSCLKDRAAKANITIRRVPGVDGRRIPQEDWLDFDRYEFERHTGRSVLPGEYGCYRSHLLALQMFLNQNVPYGLIIEDDVFPDQRTAARVSAIIDSLGEFDVVRLVSHRSRLFVKLATTSEGDQTGRTVFGPQGSAAAYLVSREGAAKILGALSRMYLPWDVALERFWSSQTEIFSTKENVFNFSAHRADSTIIPPAGYTDTKFALSKRIGAMAFQLRDGFVRAHHVLLPPKLARNRAFEESGQSLDPSGKHSFALAIFGALGTLIFLSAIWYESDAYRVAGIVMVVAALVHYFKTDLYSYSKPLIGWMGLVCALWTGYVLCRMGISYFARPGQGFGSAEGIYLLPLLYPTFGYALYLFVRRPFEIVVLFMVTSLVQLLLLTNYSQILMGLRPSVLSHNNSIHAANASGFIALCAIAFGGYILRRTALRPKMQKVLFALAFSTFALAVLNVFALFSKGVWLALAVSLVVLLGLLAPGKGNWHGRVTAMLVLALVAAGIFLFEGKLRASGERAAENTISLITHVVTGGDAAKTVSDAIANPRTTPSVRSRLMLWSNAAEIWGRHPVFGSGIAWLDDWDNRKYKEAYTDLLHNGYLEIAVRYGVTGLIFYAFLFSWSLWTVRKAARADLVDPSAYHAHMAAMVFFCISLFTNSNIRLAFGETYMWFAVSFGFYCQYLLQQKRLANINTYA